MKRRSQLCEAYVLHRYDWSESSLILDLFTREQGRLAVAAKGAKRPYSQLRSVLLPFQRIQATLAMPAADETAEVHVLRHADWGGDAPALAGQALFAGFYLNELLMKLVPRHDPHARLFDAYAASLRALAGSDEAQAQAVLRAFELVLLREAGVLADLGLVTATQQPVQAASAYELRADQGIVPGHDEGETLAGAALFELKAALGADDWAALQAACAAALPALRQQLRSLIQYHLGHTALRTRQVLLDVRRLLDPRDVSAP